MAGHSKWANIKHKKGREDAKKGKLFSKLSKMISVAAREGGDDPDMNSELRLTIQKAKDNNMPNDNIERAIKRGTGDLDGVSYERFVYEGYGPGGVAVIVEAATDNRNRTAADVRHYFDKFGGNLGTTGCVSFMFDKKGLILIDKSVDKSEDELMMEALEAGAEDFNVDEEYYEIITDFGDFSNVREALEKSQVEFESADLEMIPQTTTKLTDDKQIELMEKLIDHLEDLDDVQKVYHNWEID